MRKLTLANLRANPIRFIATMLAIVIGTGFLAGTLVLSDSLSTALRSSASVALKGVDAAVQPSLEGQGRGGPRRTDPLTDAGIPATALTTVQGTSGVGGAAGNVSANLNVLGADGSALLKEANGSAWIPVEALNPYRIVAGSAPTQSGQITVDQDTANRKHWAVGDTLSLATTSGQQSAQIVGLTRYGNQSASGSNGDIVVNEADAFAFLTSGRPVYDSIYVQAASGTSPEAVTASLQQALGDQYTVQSGDALRADAAGSAAAIADAIGTGLQIFAYIALFVGCFIIYNTFTIVVAQRVREFALLRAIGASGKQVRRAVLLEALVVGVIASAIGMLIGIGLFLALKVLVPQFKVLTGSGDVSLRVTPGAVIQVMAVGVIVTVVSAFIPAFRAARIKPIAALRMAAIDRSGTNRFRAGAGLFFLVLGVVVLLAGTAASQAIAIGAGALLSFLGVLIGGPVLAGGFASGLGLLLNRLGMPSRLAVANAKRNPSRTATTANALVIGVFLVVFVTAAGGAVRDYSVKTISQFAGADLNVATTSAGISPDLQSQIEATPGIQSSTAVYDGVGLVTSAEGRPVAAGDLAQLQSVLGVKVKSGDFGGMTDSQIAVPEAFGARGGAAPQLGDPVEVTFKSGVSKQFTVGAIIQLNLDVPGDVISSDAALAANPGLLPNKVAITVEPGQLNSVKDALDDLTASYSSIQVQAGNAFAQTIKGVFNFLISSVNALLALAVVIAAFGIVNTLILSVTERTPEIGLLRSVGMSRRQLRSSIRSEAIIVAADGTVIGIVFGLFVAWAVTQPLFQDGASFSWPVKEMGAVVLLGLLIGVLASLVPAWRASRLDILDSISAE